MMKKIFIDTENLGDISTCLEQLVNAEQAQLSIEQQLDQSTRRGKAETALRAVKAKRRIITARLAVLRQQEKVRNMHNHDRYLIAELRKIVTPSSFERCARLATEKMENTASQHEF
ncbi:hypothetical protein [Mangrovibacter phragmitis]|uniref:hypothetical protein n=1 Tax=Mangrovibacter phragmitis TaxID=1691903 RepID=UPI003369CC23